jgi:hypothetical protein
MENSWPTVQTNRTTYRELRDCSKASVHSFKELDGRLLGLSMRSRSRHAGRSAVTSLSLSKEAQPVLSMAVGSCRSLLSL